MKKLIMTAGPTYVNEEVRKALSKPLINPDYDLDFYELYKRTADKLAALMETGNRTLILNGEGILGLEAACASLTVPGDKVLCIDNGIFGKGFGDFAKMYGGEVTYFSGDYRRGIDVQELSAFLKKNHDFKYATVVHCETPSGIVNPVNTICPLLADYGILSVVDSVSAIGGEKLRTDEWKIDIILGGSQKVLSAPPGLTFMSISDRAWEAIIKRKVPIAGFYCNLAIWDKWYEKKWFPYTQPVNDIYALDTAAELLLNDKDRIKRHEEIARKVRSTIIQAGLELYPQNSFANTVTAIMVPESLDDRAFRKHLSQKYGVMLSGNFDVLEGKVMRIGHMGENCYEEKLYKAMKAMNSAFKDFSIKLDGSLQEIFSAL